MSEHQRDYEEKRDFIRMNLNSEATLHYNNERYPALCVDLSSTGIQLHSNCKLAVGDEVEVEIGSQHSQLTGLRARATVVRSSLAGDGENCIVGLKIDQML